MRFGVLGFRVQGLGFKVSGGVVFRGFRGVLGVTV